MMPVKFGRLSLPHNFVDREQVSVGPESASNFIVKDSLCPWCALGRKGLTESNKMNLFHCKTATGSVMFDITEA